jgi:hypothetical protein
MVVIDNTISKQPQRTATANRWNAKMMKTVFLGGFGLLLLIGAMVKLFIWLEQTQLSHTSKRFIHLGMGIFMITIAVLVIRWHRDSWVMEKMLSQ